MQTLLKGYDSIKVDVFIKYINRLKTELDSKGNLNAPWSLKVKDEDFAHLFEKVAAEKLWIDGETITIQYKKKLILSFGYQAYKNKVKSIYPETIFDMQLVKKGDALKIKKESGRVIYSHEISDPFSLPSKDNIIGAYCIIKNNTGEFFESMGLEELEKCRKTSKMDYIWNAWLGEMYLKTVIKRGCKRHFSDMFSGIEKLDNEGYGVNLLNNKVREDGPLKEFKKIAVGRPDEDEIIEIFQSLETDDEKRSYYSQIVKENKEMKKK